MKIGELIGILQNMDPDSEVLFSYNYGDYWRTDVADEIKEVNEETVEYSDYHRRNRLVSQDEIDRDEDE